MRVAMPTTIDRNGDIVRVLERLGVGPLDLIAAIRDEIVVLDGEGRVVAALGAGPHESARGGEELIGKTLRQIFGRQAAAVHEAAEMRARQGADVTYEWIRRKGRELAPVSTTASPLRDASADVVGVVLITRNVSSSRLLELEHGIEQLAGAIENLRKADQLPREFRRDSPLHALSSRERQVLDLLGHGYRPRSIAEKLHVSPETVRNHLKAMFKKTDTHSQEELTALLRASGAF